jgi:hypothetical protein
VVGFGVAEAFLAMNEDDGLVGEGEPGRREFCGRVGEHLLQFSSARARHGGSLAEFYVLSQWPGRGASTRPPIWKEGRPVERMP